MKDIEEIEKLLKLNLNTKSWYYLILAIEKIEELKHPKYERWEANVNITKNFCEIYFTNFYVKAEIVCSIRGKSKYESTYEAVKEFINWYKCNYE